MNICHDWTLLFTVHLPNMRQSESSLDTIFFIVDTCHTYQESLGIAQSFHRYPSITRLLTRLFHLKRIQRPYSSMSPFPTYVTSIDQSIISLYWSRISIIDNLTNRVVSFFFL